LYSVSQCTWHQGSDDRRADASGASHSQRGRVRAPLAHASVLGSGRAVPSRYTLPHGAERERSLLGLLVRQSTFVLIRLEASLLRPALAATASSPPPSRRPPLPTPPPAPSLTSPTITLTAALAAAAVAADAPTAVTAAIASPLLPCRRHPHSRRHPRHHAVVAVAVAASAPSPRSRSPESCIHRRSHGCAHRKADGRKLTRGTTHGTHTATNVGRTRHTGQSSKGDGSCLETLRNAH